MNIEVPTKQLQEAVSYVERTAAKNLSLPVLSTIYLSFTKRELILRTTNLSLGVEYRIPIQSEVEENIAIEAPLFSNVVHTLPDSEKVKLVIKNTTLLLSTKQSNSTLKTVPSEDFPTLPKAVGKVFELPADSFVDSLRSVYYSTATSDIKPEIASVFLYPEDGKLISVATDSFRLAEKKVTVKKLPDFDGILIPFKNIAEIIRLLSNKNGTLTCTTSETQLSITIGSLYITSRLIDGNFPDYKQIIPLEKKTQVTVLKHDFQEALKVANIFTGTFNQVSFRVQPKKKIFEITTTNSDIGENTTTLEAALEGEDVEIQLNQRYILDCMQSISKDSITLSFNGETKPVVLQGVSDQSFLYLVMPMNR